MYSVDRWSNAKKILNQSVKITLLAVSTLPQFHPSIQCVKPTKTDTTISQTSLTCPSTCPSGDAWMPVTQNLTAWDSQRGSSIQHSLLPFPFIIFDQKATWLLISDYQACQALSHYSTLIYTTHVARGVLRQAQVSGTLRCWLIL